MEENKILIIAGMHRSGTSLITQWLHKCGLNVGESLLGAGLGNEDGHFEDNEFLNIHIEHLLQQNAPSTGFISKPVPSFSPEIKYKLEHIIRRKNLKFSRWGWKEPRTCLFLNEYSAMIPSAKYLIIYRDFHETVSSMVRRIQKDRDDRKNKKGKFQRFIWKVFTGRFKKHKILVTNAENFLRVWIFYNSQISAFINKIDSDQYILVNYQSLLLNDRKYFSVISNEWNFSLDYIPFEKIFKPKLLNRSMNFTRYVKKEYINQAEELYLQLKRLG